ncbi:fungal peroxidase [Roridomyces roridus]|uniref:Fungal peroxidase n=1 Tax=Roridomyces roridus TaxID=1738132 RepID=A0AAD7C261_9AGAR|nr:fungal peroxidase [Roridomyces roridus]
MKVATALAGLILSAVGAARAAEIRSHQVDWKRDSSLLIDPAAMPKLPTPDAAKAASNAAGLNLSDIQGDILIGMKKNTEFFLFFTITDVAKFKQKLKSSVLPMVTSTTQVLNTANPISTMLNIAFSQTGLSALKVAGGLNDPDFSAGQLANAVALGDPGSDNWVSAFKSTSIHGVILLASDTTDNLQSTVASVRRALAGTINEAYSLNAAARPGSMQGHEHFGYLDGISNPAVQGFQSPLPGQAVIPPGEILVGETGDDVQRPAWAKDGSFLVFRQLKQLVPEFNKFLSDNPITTVPGLTKQQGSDLLGARMMGRWKSGAPVFLAPTQDNPQLGADPHRNNDFTYAAPGQTVSDSTDQSKCPFAAHIRKTRPRADLGLPESKSNSHHIVRGGIPYGPEVSQAEASSHTTKTERGLAFVAYQANIGNGFSFLQRFWADNSAFLHQNTGFDPIVGENGGSPRAVFGLDPKNSTKATTLPMDFVVSRGGEYFFSPSISAIRNTLSA